MSRIGEAWRAFWVGSQQENSARSTGWLVGCAGMVMAGLAFNLGGHPLIDPDEGRNAEVAREMAVTHDYVIPHLNGLPYLDKPVLFFAVTAASIKLLGPTELAARLPSLLFTLATIALTAWFAARLLGRDSAWIAGIATAASPLTLVYARSVIFDAMLTFFIVLSLVSIYVSVEHLTGPGSADSLPQARRAAARWTTLAWIAMGLGVLTKGPIALALPLIVAAPYAAWRRAWRAVWSPLSLLLFLILVGPWVLAVMKEVPGFPRYVLFTETFARLTTDDLHRNEPFWYFLHFLLLGALPWSVVTAAGFRRAGALRADGAGLDRRTVFLLAWVVIPFTFFSLSHSKRPQYILPLVPAMALLVARLWIGRQRRLAGARGAGAALAALGLFFVVAHELIPSIRRVTPAVIDLLPGAALAEGALMLLAGGIAWLGAARREVVLAALSLPVAAIPFVGSKLILEISHDYSAAEVAAALEPVITPETQVVGIALYPQSLPFYLKRTLIVSTPSGGKMKSNYISRNFSTLQDAPGSPFRPADWWIEALETCDPPRVFVLRSKDFRARRILAARLPLIIDTGAVAAYGPCAASSPAGKP